MSSPYNSSTNPNDCFANRNRHGQEQFNVQLRPELRSPEQLERIAHMVACGELPLPADLSPDQLELVVYEVRKRRRQRLVRYIARAIAQDIDRG